MDTRLLILLDAVLAPLIIGGLIAVGWQSIRRIILLLSAAALLLAGMKWVLFVIESAQGAIVNGHLRLQVEPPALTLETVRTALLFFALFLGVAAWLVALADTATKRQRTWFCGILAAALLSYVAQTIDIEIRIGVYSPATFLLLGTVPHLSALVTFVYALRLPARPNPS